MKIPDSIRQEMNQTCNRKLIITSYEGQVQVIFKPPQPALNALTEPPRIRHFLFLVPMPTAPVIGWFFEIQDDPERPFQLNTFFNIQDAMQREILAQLSFQTSVPFYILHGERLKIAASIPLGPPSSASKFYASAVASATEVGPGYDYLAAKTQFEADYPIDKIATWLPSHLQ